MGWYKEYLQDLAEIERAENHEKAMGCLWLICFFTGMTALQFLIEFWAEGFHIKAIIWLVFYIAMLIPTFLFCAKGLGGGSGCFAILITTAFQIGFAYHISDPKVFAGYWHWHNQGKDHVLEISSYNGKDFTINAADGIFGYAVREEKEKDRLCSSTSENFCITVKGDSLHLKKDGHRYGYIRISEEKYKEISVAIKKQMEEEEKREREKEKQKQSSSNKTKKKNDKKSKKKN